jgi:hypothetical protein
VTGSLHPDTYDLADTLRMRLAESTRPASSHVETELQQLASRRLDTAAAVVPKRRSFRGRGARTATTAGAFDSPQGFAFHADA